ncbi:MAG: hypothetical protein ACXV5H_12515 [Halobacteriota archaeon]
MGRWTLVMRPALFSATGLPIPQFGEDPIDLTFDLIPGTVKRYEEISLKQAIELQVLMSLVPAIMERASVTIVDRVPKGEGSSTKLVVWKRTIEQRGSGYGSQL